MSKITDGSAMSSTDPRHRSFHLTRPATDTAHLAPQEMIAGGWIRLVDSKGVPYALRIDTITAIVGPFLTESQWAVRLVSDTVEHDPIAFADEETADFFVDDLLHGD